jgi:hypothetical protein
LIRPGLRASCHFGFCHEAGLATPRLHRTASARTTRDLTEHLGAGSPATPRAASPPSPPPRVNRHSSTLALLNGGMRSPSPRCGLARRQVLPVGLLAHAGQMPGLFACQNDLGDIAFAAFSVTVSHRRTATTFQYLTASDLAIASPACALRDFSTSTQTFDTMRKSPDGPSLVGPVARQSDLWGPGVALCFVAWLVRGCEAQLKLATTASCRFPLDRKVLWRDIVD